MTNYENCIFYAYLNWQKENKKSTIYKLPATSKLLLISLVIVIILYIEFLYHDNIIGIIASMIGIVINYIVISFYNEYHRIKNYIKEYDDYKKYCSKLYQYLHKLQITDKEQITSLRNSVQKKIELLKSNINIMKEKINNGLKLLIIPIVLAITEKIIDKQIDINNKIVAYIILILIFCSIIYFVIYVVLMLGTAFSQHKIHQFQCFADDLQGIIDIKAYKIKCFYTE